MRAPTQSNYEETPGSRYDAAAIAASEREGRRLQQLFRDAIQRAGQEFRLQPSPARQAAGQVARTLYATVETPNANDIGHIRIEGDRNAASPVPIVFTFAGGAGVHENDRVEYAGCLYVLLNALPQTFQGVELGIRCVGVRVREV